MKKLLISITFLLIFSMSYAQIPSMIGIQHHKNKYNYFYIAPTVGLHLSNLAQPSFGSVVL